MPKPFHWGQLALLSAAVTLTVSLETLPAGTLPAIAADFGISDSGVGRLVSVWGLTVILTSIPLVRWLSTRDRRLVTALSLGVTALFSLGTAFAPTYEIALLTRIGGGASHGVFWALVVVYAVQLAPPRFLAPGVALVTGGAQIAAAVAIPIAASVVGLIGWRAIFVAVSLLAILVMGAVLLFLPADHPHAAPRGGGSGAPWRDQRILAPLALAGVALFFTFSHFTVYTYSTVFFVTPDGASDPRLGLYLAIIGISSIVGLTIAGPLATRWPRYGLVFYMLLFAAAVLLVIPYAFGIRVVGLVLWGTMFGLIGAAAQAVALRFTPEELRPTISAAMVVTFNLGISSGSFVGGVTTDAVGAYLSPYIAATALILGAGLAWWAGSRLREEPRQIPAV